MGFRTGAYATIWSAEPISDTVTKCRISVSRKNKNTGEYETDFSGYVAFLGTATAKKALGLKEKDRIKIADCDVKTHYDKAKNVTYYNFSIFSFETGAETQKSKPTNYAETPVEDSDVSDNLPF